MYSDPNYPQFGYSDNVNLGIHFYFDKSQVGHISSEDSAIVIQNLNKVTPIKILSVSASGLAIAFDAIRSPIILPGQSVKIKYSGTIPKVNAKRTDITVQYAEGTSRNSLTRGFTVNNMPKAA